jgi:hypothetical protein
MSIFFIAILLLDGYVDSLAVQGVFFGIVSMILLVEGT